ncbi:MAG: molybdopterin-dependent oxidoreductase, partial [Synergistaceae bacterium]|nr:molybdopterin-dependent oxidoreductase [Synergistaceae bacterium]
LHIKLVLSTVAHGIIKSIDKTEAERTPGVAAVFSYKDVPHKQYSSYRTFPEQELCPEDRYIFADKARFIGDAIAAVVAEDVETARAAARKVKVEYEELPAMATPERSLSPNVCPIHGSGNLIEEFDYEKTGKKYAPDDEEEISVTTEVVTQKMNHMAMETHSYSADYKNGEITIWTPTQGVFGVRTVVADLLGMPYNRIRVIKTPMGGSFGGKQEFIYEPMVAFIAMKTKSPVRLHLDRRESIIATIGRSYSKTRINTSFNKDGMILSCDVDNLFDAGAYAGSSLDQLHAMKTKMPKLYRMPEYRHHGCVAYSNTPLAGGMRGWGSPEMITALEIHMNLAARAMQMDPFEMHMKNLVEANDIDICSGISVGNCRVKECLRVGAEAFSWRSRYSAQPKDKGRFRRGVGLACGAHKNGLFNGTPDLSTMTIRMNEDGSVAMQTSIHDVGCGTVRSMQIITAEVLNIHPDNIQVTEGDTKYTPYDCGSYGSRVTYVAGECARRAAESLKSMIMTIASGFLDAKETSLHLTDSAVETDTGVKITYCELAKRALMELHKEMIITESYNSIDNPGAYAVNFAEVEVDTYTGLIKVTDFLSVNDIGQAINRDMVFRQVEGAVQMSLGYALCEDLGIDDSGKAVKDTLRKYHTLNCADMPRVKTILVEDGGDNGPYGAKSIGEISTVAGSAAAVNAINNALGTKMTDLPLTPEKIIDAVISLEKQ